ncbi:S8 family serine peptidase [Planomonospora venezuelensis]|uniref:Subtilisin family serine protease n=1 Tax=Planomonospora venezuelensis TaxID=1999 RepID=A0A841DEK4_PLAVE|nr:S8 family serine peptidase [Planomonospora venezuelensis]MBB5967347.1 subtilisin family serine protease [Planomonospora venezuelensis]
MTMRRTGKRRPHGPAHAAAAATTATKLTTVGLLTLALLGGTSLAAHAGTAGKPGPVRKPAGQLISGQYIVVLKNGTATTTTAVRKQAGTLTSRRGGKVARTFAAGIKGFTVRASEAQARLLAGDPAVAYVEQDARIHASDTQNGPAWGLDRLDQRTSTLDGSYTYDTTASGVDVYVIDTGIRATHTDFGGRVTGGTDTVGDGYGTADCNGHGTHVAATIGGQTWGVAKGVDLHPVRVLGCDGSGSLSGVIAGVDWVTQNATGPSVANMSLGGGASTALDDAVRRSVAAGVTYVVAAGNSAADACAASPARVGEAVTVGATATGDRRASFSNYGRCLDLFAPGAGVASAWHTGDTATRTISGTSMASPHVAGAAALHLAADPGATPAQVSAALTGRATPGAVGNPGTGSPDLLAYTGTEAVPAPPAPEPEPPAETHFTNDVDVPLSRKWRGSTGALTVRGMSGGASTATVTVAIKRASRADLTVSLVLPDGRTVPLRRLNPRDRGADLDAVYTVPVTGRTLDGAWKLRVQTLWPLRDNGYLDSWSVRFR